MHKGEPVGGTYDLHDTVCIPIDQALKSQSTLSIDFRHFIM